MNFAVNRLYPRAPVFVQNAACSYYGWREGRIRFSRLFDDKLEWLMYSERWSQSDIEAYQDNAVRRLVSHAFQNVPYYRARMLERKVSPQDIHGVGDLYKLPITTKQDVREHCQALKAVNIDRSRLIARHTSGTTGTALEFFSTPESVAFQWAVWWRHRARFGFTPGDWHVNFTGKLVVPPAQSKPPYWRWNWPMRQVLVNMHHFTADKVAEVARFLTDRGFQFYTGYPSVIHSFVVAAQEAGLPGAPRPRLVVTGAENVLAPQRRDLESYLGARVTDQYGLSEGCGNASECPESVYHEDFEFGVLECVDAEPVERENIRGRIVCTGFANDGFPLIRYDVGDFGVWLPPGTRCACGREARMLARIEGRIDDYVLTPEGRRIMRFDYIFKEMHHVAESQVVQRNLGEITVRIVKRDSYSSRDEAQIKDEIRAWISPRLTVAFEYVGRIERERSGKFRAVKSELNRDDLAVSMRA